jgi:serine protease inhibitor
VATFLLFVGKFLSCNSQCLTGNDNPITLRTDAAQKLSNAHFNFALEALKRVADIEIQENIFFSPHSLHEALSLAYFGARGTTEESLKKALYIPVDFSKIDVQRFYAFKKSLEEEQKVKPKGFELNLHF